MRRRAFMTLVGLAAAAAWPLAARAQQAAMPVVGFLSAQEVDAAHATAFRKGLNEAGFIEDQNVRIEYRWANNDYSRVPALAADLVDRHVAVIAATGGDPTVLAAKAAAGTTIPIVFNTGSDPVRAGLVAAMNKPGGNITGVTSMNFLIGTKWLGLLHDLLPTATRFALLLEPPAASSNENEILIADVQAAATAAGLQLEILYATTIDEVEKAIAAVGQKRVGALMIAPGAMFLDRRAEIATLALRVGLPAIYVNRAFAEAGGLMSYGSDYTDSYRQNGVYCGRILKGEKPADMPVQQATRFVFVINLRTAKALGLTIPSGVLAIADEVIE
jgi:putative tryptophan/tyrosine transport system substrate-binding protein